jgi:hypothetical protein
MIVTLVCTRKTLNRFPWHGIAARSDLQTRPDFLRWYCNVITLRRRTGLLLVHEQSLFSFLVYPFRAGVVKQIRELFLSSLRRALTKESVPEDLVQVMDGISEFVVESARNRSVLGCMNDIRLRYEANVYGQYGHRELDASVLAEITHRVNDCPWVKHKFFSHEEFPRQLRAFVASSKLKC